MESSTAHKDLLTQHEVYLNPPVPAGFWLRFAALIIDGIVLRVLSYILTALVGFSLQSAIDSQTAQYNWGLLVGLMLGGDFIINTVYFTLMEGSPWQATLGKRALNLKVTDARGEPITYGKALLRNLMKAVSTFIVFLGFIMAAFTEKKQALHDLIAGTHVVKN